MDGPQVAEQQRPAAVAAPRRRPPRGLSDRAVKYLCVVPVLALLIGFNVFPLLASLFISFTAFNPVREDLSEARYVGLENYSKLINDPESLYLRPQEPWKAFQRTAAVVLVTVTLQTAIGFGVALLLHRSFPGQGVVTALLLVPMMLSPAVVALSVASPSPHTWLPSTG